MLKFVIFKINEENFGIGIEKVVEIQNTLELHSIPDMPEFMSGVMNLRGTLLPVIDLRKRFGMMPAGKRERVIVVRYEDEKIGLLVDEVEEILPLSPDQITPPSSVFRGIKAEYLSGLGKNGENVIIILNIDRVLSSEEKIKLLKSINMLEGKVAGNEKTA